MIIQNGKLKVRRLEIEDNLLLVKWLSDSQVLRYYEGRDCPFNLDKVNQKFYGLEPELIRCIIEWDGKSIGYIQFYLLDQETIDLYGYELDAGVIYGTDQFIGEIDYWNKGLGTLLVKTMITYLADVYQADRVVMDPQTWNKRAIHCYENGGLEKVRLLPKHEYHEGEYCNCWLMEWKKTENN